MKATSPKKKTPVKAEVKENSFPVVAIGASAGGLEAMMELLKYLPADTGMAFIYVQHLSPDHKSMLTEILSKKTKMIVQEIDDMDKIKPNNVFVIPYNKGIEVTDGHIKLIPRSNSSAAISIDILFSSLAEAQKERVIGIILSGSASDGTVGMKAIKHEGGLTFAQDDSAKFTSMPHSAIAAGMVDFILSPKEIALELARLSKHPLIKTVGVKNGEEDLIDNSNPDLKIILNQLHKATGVDFSAYKMNTIKRRIIRRMLLYKITQLKEYANLLSQKKPARTIDSVQSGGQEIDILYQDLLINVTSFFRDTDTHKYLKESLFPKLLKRKKIGESLRIWVPACATGEEAYSIAMMLLEIQESKTSVIPVQIFATDLSIQAINKARIGIYTKQELETVSPKRIQRFFIKADGGFRVNKAVRDMCVFAPHNILRDPPFSRLDFISCCNLFIYLDNAAQKKAVNTFHYALNDVGFLMLGKSENISQSANLFTSVNKKYKIFSRKIITGTRTAPLLPEGGGRSREAFPVEGLKKTLNKSVSLNPPLGGRGADIDNAIDALLVSDFMPASVVINHQMEIVQFRGTTDLFLTHPKGKATFNILKMARPEISFELRNAISKVIKTKHRIRKSGIEFKINSTVRIISLEIVPLKIEGNEPLLLILFTEQEQAEIYSLNSPLGGRGASPAKDRRIKKLEQELAAAHADALAIAQEQEAFTEELQSANEEVVSSNEELQTVNEELETSKEEIESANEELTTTNQELQTRNDLLNESYDYSEAVLSTIHDPMIVLDKNLRVKSANKTFYKIFNVKEEETEGMLLYDLGNKQWNIPRLRELLEDILTRNSHFYDFEIKHSFPFIGEKIMLLNARRIIQKRNHEELILLAFADVTEVRKKALELQTKENEILSLQLNAEQKLRKIIEDSEKRYNMMLMQSPFAFAVLKGKDMVVTVANDSIKQTWGKGNKVEGKPLVEVLPEIKDQEFPALLHKVYTTGIPYMTNESLARVKRKDKMEDLYFNFSYQPFIENDGTISGVIIFATEVTEQVIVKKALEAQNEKEKKALKLVEEINKRYYTMLMESPFAFSVMKGKDMVVTLANDLIKEFWGKGNEVEGKTLLQVLPELKDQPFPAMLDKAYTTGIPVYVNEILAQLNRHGIMEDMYFNIVYQPDHEADGTISGVITIAYDVTEMVLARKKIEDSDKRFRTLVEQAPVAMCVVRGDKFVFEVANEKHLQLIGKTKEQIMNMPVFTALPEAAEQGYEALLGGVYETGIPFTASESPLTVIRNGKEETIYVNFVFEPLYDTEHKIDGVFSVASDVTEQVVARKRIEESETLFRLALLLTAKTVFKQDTQLRYTWIYNTHPALEVNDIVGKTDSDLFNNDAAEILTIIKQSVLKTGITFNDEIQIEIDGKLLCFAMLVEVTKDIAGKNNGIIAVSDDITERKQIEKKLIEAKELAENVAKSKQQFLSNMSHEIRTPLNSILGFTNVLLKTELGVEQKEFVQAIKTSGKSLNLLINDILDLAKVDAGKMTFEKQPFEIRKSITLLLHSFDLKIKEKNVELIKEYDSKIPSMLLGDSLRLNQIILNLISNAVKFTHKGKIILSIKLLNEDKENMTIEFAVSDSGIGIADNKLNSIFNAFEQAEISTSTSYGGTGLGLAIVKQLVEGQGGSINLRSKLGEGSTFSFILTFGKTNIKSEAEVVIPKLDLKTKNLRVLVAEDVALNQLLIKIILSDFGFDYEIVDNGKIAIEKMQTNTYDIILMDLQMPEMNGFEATEYIRKTMKSQIPIIALTADVTTTDVSKCKEFGMDDYISKPINENLLYSKIVALVKKKY